MSREVVGAAPADAPPAPGSQDLLERPRRAPAPGSRPAEPTPQPAEPGCRPAGPGSRPDADLDPGTGRGTSGNTPAGTGARTGTQSGTRVETPPGTASRAPTATGDGSTPQPPAPQLPSSQRTTPQPATPRPPAPQPATSTRGPAGAAATPDPAPAEAPPEEPERPGRRPAAAVLVAVLVVSALAGWTGSGSWRTTQDEAQLITRQRSVAVVVQALATDVEVQRVRSVLSVRVSNVGAVPVDVIGADESFDAGSVTGIDGAPRSIPVGGSTTLTVRTTILCRSSRPLRLPPLLVRGPDGVRRELPLVGATQALADMCGGPGPVLVELVGAAVRDGDRLRLQLRAPTGRATRVTRLLVAGVPLAGSSLPLQLDERPRTVWLDRPARCAPAWQAAGLPTHLDVDLDVGGPATTRMPVGLELPRWLMDGACRRPS